MCRNIQTHFSFSPPATEEEIRAASLPFVRKLSDTTRPNGPGAGRARRKPGGSPRP